MTSVSFDLAVALGSYPANVLCVRCGGLIENPHDPCPICANVLFTRPQDPAAFQGAFSQLEQRLSMYNCRLKAIGGDVVNPVRDWEQIGRVFEATRFLAVATTPPPPGARPRIKREHSAVGRFMNLLSTAKQFIHFSSYGVSDYYAGFLKALSHKEGISVRGIVVNPEPSQIEPLTSFGDAPDFEVHAFNAPDGLPEAFAELIVIDGLVAIWGSALLKPEAWSDLIVGQRRLDVITESQMIVDLNNRWFAQYFGASSMIDGWNIRDARIEMVGRVWDWVD